LAGDNGCFYSFVAFNVKTAILYRDYSPEVIAGCPMSVHSRAGKHGHGEYQNADQD